MDFVFLFLFFRLFIKLKTRIPLAVRVCFNKLYLRADFGGGWIRNMKLFPVWKKKNFWRRKMPKTVSRTSQQINCTWKPPSQPKKTGRETIHLVILRWEPDFVFLIKRKSDEMDIHGFVKSSWSWPLASCNLLDFNVGEQKKLPKHYLFARPWWWRL